MIINKIICLLLLSSAPYLFSLNGNFVFDDSEAIVKNKDLTSESWLDPFYSDFWGTNIKSNLSHKSYRPLTVTSFRLNYYMNNNILSASQFKAVNLILHIICCVLVWLTFTAIWRRVDERDELKNKCLDIPYLAALLFSTHPVHVEAVSGIVGRADILAAFTFFSAILVYDKSMDEGNMCNIYLSLSIILSGMSMLFKENGITVLGFCSLYDILSKYQFKSIWCKKKTHSINIHQNRLCIKRIVCVISSLLLILYGRWVIMGGSKPEFKSIDNPAAFTEDFFSKVSTYNYIYFLNLLLLLWPYWLCYDWSMGCVPLIKHLWDYRIIFVVFLYIYGILFVLKCVDIRRNKLNRNLIFAFLLIVIPFLPAANIFYPVGFVIAERILYIPSAGYCLLICIGLEKIYYKSSKHKLSVMFFYFNLFIFGLQSWHRAYDWQNEYKLFISGLSVCPLNAKIHYNVAKVVDANNDTEWAISEYRTAISLNPEYYQAMNNLANLLKNKKQFSEAESYLRLALHFKKDFPAAWMNLGIVLANMKQYKHSEEAYKMALNFRNKYPDCYYNLGNLYLELNHTEDAMENWFKAIDINPTHASAWTNLLALLDNTGQINTALKIIPRALAELPNSPSINFAVANIYGKINQYDEAEKHFLKAINNYENKAKAIYYANLGVLYHRWKKYDLAAQMYKKALKINPNFISAKKNLETIANFLK